MHRIEAATTNEDYEIVRQLFREYERWLGLSLCFQDFDRELLDLPGKYAPPEGRLYIAFEDFEAIGCIAMRKLDDGICEMKRLYLRESARGHGLGNALIQKLIDDARSVGYRRMRLDTYPPKMGKAVKLYESHGFRAIDPYYDNPHKDTIYMELKLS